MSRKYCEVESGTRARNRPSGALQTQPRSYLTARARVHRNAFDMEGNEKYDEVGKPCAACKKLKKFCPHGIFIKRPSQQWACATCRELKVRCTHQPRAGGAAADTPKRAEAAPKPAAAPARMSYAAVLQAASPVRGLTGPELEAAAVFAAPGPREYEVIYFDENRVRVPWNRALR